VRLVALVASLHLYFLVLEMFLWQTPFGRRTFRTTPEGAASCAVLAANQGLYNGFLAAGLLWALVFYGVGSGSPFLIFLLLCVVVAGVYGGATVSRRILLVQALPRWWRCSSRRWRDQSSRRSECGEVDLEQVLFGMLAGELRCSPGQLRLADPVSGDVLGQVKRSDQLLDRVRRVGAH